MSKPTLEELVNIAASNPMFRDTLIKFPETYSHLSDEDQAKLAEALEAEPVDRNGDIGLDPRRTKFGGESSDVGDQGSWPNTPFTG